MARFVEGNDDTFVMLLFGFFAFACCLLMVEPLFRHKTYLAEIMDTMFWWKKVLGLVTTEPGKITKGFEILRNNLAYTRMFIFPLAKTILNKWRWGVWIVTLVLFSLVAYQKLTFDPYEVLGIPSGSELKVIKKAYRKLSKELHPDVNSTEAAAAQYAMVKKASRILMNPEQEAEIMAEEGEMQHGVGIPSFLTKREYAVYSMTGLMIVLFAVPIYMLFSLKNKQTFNLIPAMIEVAQNAEMAEPFFTLLGQPRNPLREYATAERPKLVAYLKQLESAEVFYQPEDEIPLKPSEMAEHFHPEICSRAEVQLLLLDVIEKGKKSAAAETRLKTELGVYIEKELMEVLQTMVEMPSEEEVKAFEDHKAKTASKAKEDCDYTAASEEQRSVAIYLLSPLLNTVLFQMSRLFPPQEGQRKDPTMALKNVYMKRLDILATLRKQADQRGDAPITKVYRAEINRAIDEQQTCDRALNDMVLEIKTRCKANQRRWRMEHERAMRAANKAKKGKK